jgi:hypothetical protein
MALPPSRDHRIALAAASALLRRHREAAPNVERGGFFHAKAIHDLMAQPGCSGIRIYHGRKDDGTVAMVLVGVDASGNDMSSGVLLEEHYPCPPICPDPDGLNP